jgi:hypothetical protein
MITLLALVCVSQDAASRITAEGLKKDVEALAADGLEGRAAGTAGEEKAALYIEKRMRAMGLRPMGDPGVDRKSGYWQSYKISEKEVSRNCLGLLEGTDPRLREEVILIGAHHDGVGRVGATRGTAVGGKQGDDDIFNGADDNASGVAALLAIAEALVGSKTATKRSILFVTFGSQEGAFEQMGSRHYVHHAVTTADKHALMVNLDMIGRNPERAVEVEGVKTALDGALAKVVARAAEAEKLAVTAHDFGSDALYRSDGLNFIESKVPTLLVFTYWHKDYHRVTDHADRLSYDRMAPIARMVLGIVREVADAEKAPVWNPATPRIDDRPRLGVRFDDVTGEELAALGLGAGRGAVKVTMVAPGGPADKAGIRPGDVIVGFDGKPIDGENSLESVRSLVGKADRAKDHAVELRRKGEKAEAVVRFPKGP